MAKDLGRSSPVMSLFCQLLYASVASLQALTTSLLLRLAPLGQSGFHVLRDVRDVVGIGNVVEQMNVRFRKVPNRIISESLRELGYGRGLDAQAECEGGCRRSLCMTAESRGEQSSKQAVSRKTSAATTAHPSGRRLRGKGESARPPLREPQASGDLISCPAASVWQSFSSRRDCFESHGTLSNRGQRSLVRIRRFGTVEPLRDLNICSTAETSGRVRTFLPYRRIVTAHPSSSNSELAKLKHRGTSPSRPKFSLSPPVRLIER